MWRKDKEYHELAITTYYTAIGSRLNKAPRPQDIFDALKGKQRTETKVSRKQKEKTLEELEKSIGIEGS